MVSLTMPASFFLQNLKRSNGQVTSDALSFIVNLNSSNTVLCLLRNLIHQTLHRHFLESQTVVNTYVNAVGRSEKPGGGHWGGK